MQDCRNQTQKHTKGCGDNRVSWIRVAEEVCNRIFPENASSLHDPLHPVGLSIADWPQTTHTPNGFLSN
ncbi:hypothetical protein DESC_370123 [Desulfosarcina cetonica]|nr:hypothetical protein DESC_370123 [Desulfosarcina cetonica]